jgi:hypothetical protein
MSARRPILATLVSLGVLACALAGGVAPAGASTQFGSYGEGAGQFGYPWGIAVSQASGDVYVTDFQNGRVDEFEASGGFVRAWGWGVLNGAQELQTCTTTCQKGLEGTGPGELSYYIMGVAVDNDPLSSSYGDVYVWDPSHQRVEKYDASGGFLLEFEIKEHSDNGSVIAVGPSGRVYVGAKAEVQVFEPSGVLSESISLAGLSNISTVGANEVGHKTVSALAVDASGDMFVKYVGVPGVREFEANGKEKAMQFDTGSETVQALAVDGSGDLFVGEASAPGSPEAFRLLEYSPSGEELASFGNESSPGQREGIAFGSVLGEGQIYVTAFIGTTADVSVVPVPVSGPPVIEGGSVSAVGGRRGHATIKATLDAEGNPTTYRVEYVSEADFLASGYADASSTPEASLGKKFEQAPVSIDLSGLEPGGVYHYRIVVSSPKGSESSPDQVVEAVPPALINGPWVASVASTSATFAAEIDPLGLSTEYRIEYGPTTSYGETLTGNTGEGEAYVPVAFHRQGLLPGTMYHYRVVVDNEVGVYGGPDHTFMTQAAGGQELSLPDGRAWELVSPMDKKGALIGVRLFEEPFQAAADGGAIAYPVSEPVGEDAAEGRNESAMIISRRGGDGWSSQDVSPSNSLADTYEGPARSADRGGADLRVFSDDLSLGLYEPNVENWTPLSSETTERTLYLHDEPNGSFLSLENPADVTSGVAFGSDFMHFLAGTPDLSHVVFNTTLALTPEAVPASEASILEHQGSANENLYEWSAGKLQLVNITPATASSPDGTTGPGAFLGSSETDNGKTANTISSNGRWVAWSQGRISTGGVGLFVRDMVAGKTYPLGGRFARYETMSNDGSKVFFVETTNGVGGDLYLFDTSTGVQSDLTADHGPGESNAGVRDAVMGASEDGSYVYFVATGVLAPGAARGADNVYLLHESEGVWTTTFIATLSPQDAKSWGESAAENDGVVDSELVSSRVSPDGRYLAFMSERSLTGYDNTDAVSGQPDEEVYLYDAASNRLVCASCNPTGARPVGVLDEGAISNALLAELTGAWSAVKGTGNHWLAGSIPGWVHNGSLSVYQSRYLSNSGRLFFDSPDALVPQDTNGREDVYEYEPAGIGSCTSGSTTYGAGSGGCVGLISSGQSAGESVFIDASEDGSDVFFATSSKLVGEDYDTAYDLYDAHVCTSEVPCRSEPVPVPPCTSGDSCKAAPSPQPETFGPAPSATFSGTGNVIEEPKSTPKTKAKTKPKKRKIKTKKKKKGKIGKKKAMRAVRSGVSRASGKGGR